VLPYVDSGKGRGSQGMRMGVEQRLRQIVREELTAARRVQAAADFEQSMKIACAPIPLEFSLRLLEDVRRFQRRDR
jgi:hypothetical protein